MKRAIWTVLIVSALAVCPNLALASTLIPGDILISNHGGNNVQLLDPITGIVTTFVAVSGTPIGLAFDSSQNLFINVNNGIQKFSSGGVLMPGFFTGSGQREGLTFDPTTQHLFSVSFGGNHIEEVDLAGTLIRTITIPGTSQLLGISARGSMLAVTDFGTGKVFVGTTTGSVFSQVGTLTPGNTYAPDFDAAGNLYVNDFALGQVAKFASLGGGLFGPKSVFIAGLNTPDNGLSIGDDGSLTISEFNANRVSIYNSDGTLRRQYPGVTSPDELVVFAPARAAEIPEPASIALLASGLAVLGLKRRRRK